MMAAALLVLPLSSLPAEVRAVRLEAEQERLVVRVVTSGSDQRATAARVGEELVVTVPRARRGPGLVLPAPLGAVLSVAVEEAGEATRIRIRLAADVPYELRQQAGLVSVVLGQPAPLPRTFVEVRDLYAKILPPPFGDVGGADQGTGEQPGARSAPESEGLRFGFLRFRPAAVFSYVDTDSAFLDSPQPVHDHYFQVEPRLGFGLGATIALPAQARLQLSYEPQFRASTSFAVLRRPTHLATASLTVPVGAATVLRASHHYARGLLETTEVDPGHEYFFGLAPFIRNQTIVGAGINPSGLLSLELSAIRDSVNVDDGAFFDHRTDSLVSDLAYQLGSDTHLYLRYRFDRVPTPADRPIAQSRASTASVGLIGQVMPLLTGDVSVGFRDLAAPRAGAGGTTFRGLVAAVRLIKEFTPAASASVSGTRETYPSAFEANAFYVSTGGAAELNLGLPFSVVFRAGAGVLRNDYRVAAAGTGAPRRDTLVGWSVGVGRSLTRWAFLRTDYRHETRTSDLPAFNTHGHTFLVEFGIGYLSAPTSAVGPR